MKKEKIREILRSKIVGIAGCGGLGSNCAVALARIGLGTIVIADFDIVSPDNLNRQYFFLDQTGMKKVAALKDNIARIDPAIRVITHELKLTPDNIPTVFAGCDVIVEAFDVASEKQMLAETVLELFPQIPLVIGIGLAGWGLNEVIHYRKVGNLHICGDEMTEIGEEQPPLAPRVGIVSNMQANVVTELLLTLVAGS